MASIIVSQLWGRRSWRDCFVHYVELGTMSDHNEKTVLVKSGRFTLTYRSFWFKVLTCRQQHLNFVIILINCLKNVYFLLPDIRLMNSQAVHAVNTGMIILGGGLVKHHTCNANLMVREV